MQQRIPEIINKTWTAYPPFNTHGGECEYGTYGGHVLQVMHSLAQEESHRPRVWEQFRYLEHKYTSWNAWIFYV